MKKRIASISLYFFTVLLMFILQKPLFMLYNGSIEKEFGFTDYMQVMAHGASLDAATAGYLTVFPFLLILVSIWFKKFPLKKMLCGYSILVATLISIIFVVDMALYTFWGFKLDASVFLYIDSPKEALASVSVGFILLRVLVILLLVILNCWVLLKITPSVLVATRKRIAGTAVMLLLGGVLFLIIRGGVTESTSNVGQVYFSSEQFLNHSAVNPAFSLLSSMGKSQDFASEFNFFDEEKRAALFDGLYPTTDGDSIIQVLNTKRPNILVILMESYGARFIGPLGGISEVAPNFNRLSEEGVFFTNCYANSFRTDRGTVQGNKMGKTAGNAVWLDPNKTSPFDFYQYWRNVSDADVLKCIRMLTFLPMEQIREMEDWQGSKLNTAKEILAFELTKLVHGEEEAAKAQTAAKALFAGGSDNSDMPCTKLDDSDFTNGEITVVDMLLKSEMIKSKGEGRRLIDQGGISVNDEKVTSALAALSKESFESEIIVRKGKKIFRKFTV